VPGLIVKEEQPDIQGKGGFGGTADNVHLSSEVVQWNRRSNVGETATNLGKELLHQ
jgi:hypothetical protein